ncbi:MAG: hypothetical protein WD965_08250 [Actinomycetota bacterium]
MRRHTRFLLGTVLALVACAPDPQGPQSPIATEQVVETPALDASAARQAVVDFIDAYAASPIEGVGPLAHLVVGPELGSWVHWLNVQHREFGGSIDAVADVRDVEFIASVDARRAMGAQVGLSASVTFLFEPLDEESFERARILDGLVTLLEAEKGAYRVIDLQRDGVPMSAGIELFREETRSEGAAEATLDSLFMFPPNWQFNVVVRNSGREPLILEPDLAGLYVDGPEGFERLDPVITGSLALIPPGMETEGILAFPLQDSAQGRVLTLAYRSGRHLVQFDFPLDELVNVVPPPPPTTAGSEQDVTT